MSYIHEENELVFSLSMVFFSCCRLIVFLLVLEILVHCVKFEGFVPSEYKYINACNIIFV